MPTELELSVFLLLELAASAYQLNEALGFLACTKILTPLILTILTIQAYLCLLHQVLKLSTIIFFILVSHFLPSVRLGLLCGCLVLNIN